MKAFIKLLFAATALQFLGFSNADAQVKKMQYKNRVGDTLLVNTQEKEPKVKGPKPLNKQHSIGFRVHTDGWSGYFNYGLIRNNNGKKHEIDRFYNVLYFQFEVGERYHPKEYREFANNSINSPYKNYFLSIFSKDMMKYGKINNFYMAKIGVGYKYLLAGKPEANTVSIHWNTNAGLTMAILKPYIFTATSGDVFALNPEDPNLMTTMQTKQYTGAEGYRKGWDSLTFKPGLYARTGLKFDYANRRKRVAGFELGVGAEVYFDKIHQMALQDPKSFYVNAFVGFELGWSTGPKDKKKK